MVEGAGLESLCTVKGTVGSNPTLFAIYFILLLSIYGTMVESKENYERIRMDWPCSDSIFRVANS